MNCELTDRAKQLQEQLLAFMDAHVYPNEARFQEEVAQERWQPTRVMEELKAKAGCGAVESVCRAARG